MAIFFKVLNKGSLALAQLRLILTKPVTTTQLLGMAYKN
jgi:hypothetical protein